MKYISIILLLFIVCNTSCVEDAELPEKNYPSVDTKEAIVASTSVTLVAELIYKGSDKIIDYGFIMGNGDAKKEYSISETNDINDFKKTINTDLKRNTRYSYKAYIKTEKYIVLGYEMSFVALGSEPPTVESVAPAMGFDGTSVKLSGKYFGSDKNKRQVYVNDREARITDSGEDYISFTIPSSPFIGNATIRVVAGENEVSTKFTILGPEIESITPLTGHSGNYIVISGRYFTENGEQTNVNIGNRSGQIVQKDFGANSQVSLTVAVPPTDNLFSDISSTIQLINGEKVVQYKTKFLTKSSWINRASEQFGWAYEHDGFSYNNKGYMMDVNTMAFHEYNPLTNSWKMIEPISSKPNFYYNSLLIVSGDKFYRVGGTNYSLEENDELWYFKLSDKTWVKKNKLPFVFYRAASFKLNNNIYILTARNELWLCDFEKEEYRKLNNFPTEIDMPNFAASFVVDNKAYFMTLGKTWQYNEQNDLWIEKASYPFYIGLYYSSLNGFTYKGYGYIQLGGDIYKYDPSKDIWILASHYPDKRPYTKQATFMIDGRPYLLTTYDAHSTETFMFEYHTE